MFICFGNLVFLCYCSVGGMVLFSLVFVIVSLIFVLVKSLVVGLQIWFLYGLFLIIEVVGLLYVFYVQVLSFCKVLLFSILVVYFIIGRVYICISMDIVYVELRMKYRIILVLLFFLSDNFEWNLYEVFIFLMNVNITSFLCGGVFQFLRVVLFIYILI